SIMDVEYCGITPPPNIRLVGFDKPTSGLPLLERRIESAEFDAGLGGRELPARLDLRLVALQLPGRHLPPQLLRRPDPPPQALLAQRRQLDLRRVQPAAVPRRVMPLQLLRDPPRLRRLAPPV